MSAGDERELQAWISREDDKRLQRQAVVEGITVSALVRRYIVAGLARDEAAGNTDDGIREDEGGL